MILKFQKWHGCSNDFIIAELPFASWDSLSESIIKTSPSLCSRKGDGVGADGILLYTKDPSSKNSTSYQVLIINSDGSIAKNCGNGLRCLTAAIFSSNPSLIDPILGKDENTLCLKTAGTERMSRLVRQSNSEASIEIGMGHLNSSEHDPSILELTKQKLKAYDQKYRQIKIGWLGNPHLVIEVDLQEDLTLLANQLGANLQKNLPIDGVNVHFAKITEETAEQAEKIMLVSWERGAGLTAACGSGASVAAITLTDFEFHEKGTGIQVQMPGGDLEIFADSQESSILMRGPAVKVFDASCSV